MQYLPCENRDFRGPEGPEIYKNHAELFKKASENASPPKSVFQSRFFSILDQCWLQNAPPRSPQSIPKTPHELPELHHKPPENLPKAPGIDFGASGVDFGASGVDFEAQSLPRTQIWRRTAFLGPQIGGQRPSWTPNWRPKAS